MSPQHEAHQLTDLDEVATRPRLVALDRPVSAPALAAREVNARIAEVAETLPLADDEASYTFFCECGCLEPVPLTLAGYAAAAVALRDGHAPAD